MDRTGFKERLEKHHNWPSEYVFKFIIPRERLHRFMSIVGEAGKRRPSKHGYYIAVTISKEMDSSESVMAFYEKVSRVKGIISL